MSEGAAAKKDLGFVSINTAFKAKKIGPLLVSAYTHIGKRNNQEDRFVVAPNLLNGEYAFFGVFDGTVKEFASDFVSKSILDCLLTSQSFRTFDALPAEQKAAPASSKLLKDTLAECFVATDERLLAWCRENENHYTSTTSVTALIHIPTRRLFVAHLGDSKIILGRLEAQEGEEKLVGVPVTIDHKPDMPEERKRIEAAGGSLTYLHGGKPFIRGGDFTQRKHAMQLNYSRAFGGKDLKMYGLSAIPDINEFTLSAGKERLVVLGSDGLWDVVDPSTAVKTAELSLSQQKCPSEELGTLALKNHVTKGSADNVTTICCFFDFS